MKGSHSQGHTEAGFQCQSGGQLDLSKCVIDGYYLGVASAGSKLTAHDVITSRATMAGFSLFLMAEGMLTKCRASECESTGIQISDNNTDVHVEACTFCDNHDFGVLAVNHAVVKVQGSHSKGSMVAGYACESGASLSINHIRSVSDQAGAIMNGHQSRLTAGQVDVRNTYYYRFCCFSTGRRSDERV